MNKEENNTNNMITAFAVLIAIGAVFFAGVMYARGGNVAVAPPTDGGVVPPPGPPPVTPDLDVLMVQSNDAVRGSGDILLIEYSDYECSFCKRFHPTAQALVDSGEVAWVYRHLPLPFHVTAKDGAAVGECVKEHKGNEAFWTYTDKVFAASALDLETYKSLARDGGLSDAQIDTCLAAGSDAQKAVEQHMNDAQKMGVNGTPGSFLVNTKTKAVESIPGALPLEQVRSMLESVQ
ncbi:MAG: thioredoxin domain-containing protein [Candidatus Kaiserbacteria bacterium]|nr:thioredoxin domain-containing protein [Candidatus Kaiserbacteria bacterium]